MSVEVESSMAPSSCLVCQVFQSLCIIRAGPPKVALDGTDLGVLCSAHLPETDVARDPCVGAPSVTLESVFKLGRTSATPSCTLSSVTGLETGSTGPTQTLCSYSQPPAVGLFLW